LRPPPPAWLAGFLADEGLPPSYTQAVETVWRPLAMRIAADAIGRDAPLVVGLCGAQGSGKSTAAAVLARLLRDLDVKSAVLSIDDLYLTREERRVLAARVHPLFATRGPPGTHDISLANALFDALAAAGPVALPRFDKGQDTRRPVAEWELVQAPVDVILFEGWCVGATAQDDVELTAPVNALERDADAHGIWRAYANAQLAGPYRALFARIDLLVLIAAPGFETVLSWRIEQEHALRRRLDREGRPTALTMSDEAVARFIAHYERVTRHILSEMPARADVVVRLDSRRTPLTTVT